MVFAPPVNPALLRVTALAAGMPSTLRPSTVMARLRKNTPALRAARGKWCCTVASGLRPSGRHVVVACDRTYAKPDARAVIQRIIRSTDESFTRGRASLRKVIASTGIVTVWWLPAPKRHATTTAELGAPTRSQSSTRPPPGGRVDDIEALAVSPGIGVGTSYW